MSNHPFPFIGAGYGHYFEFCNIIIKFQQAPDEKQRKEILKNAPKPLSELDDQSFNGSMLALCSDQFVNMYIEMEYGDTKGEDIGEDEDPCFYCSDEAADAFEADIEHWLKEVHVICPIEIVYRPEDSEAGGTELSEWHKESIAPGLALIEKWKNESERYKGDEQKNIVYIIEGILEYDGNTDEAGINKTILSIFPDYERAGDDDYDDEY